ncbi:hypothetical protein HDU97_000804 [Phlyctochytrium planicorne]|nr:hypothetical protein HDU97_000804 [Phlyctochytrium planicorne]
MFAECKRKPGDAEDFTNNADSITVLMVVLNSLLEILPLLNLKLVLFIDDAQEYNIKFREYFDRFSNHPSCQNLSIDKLSNAAVEKLVLCEMRCYGFEIQKISQKLLADFIGKSKGNPMVIKLLCKFLCTSPAIVANNNVLQQMYEKAQDSVQFELPLDASAAVASTLDKMSSRAQTVLRVASVAGQYFSLAEIVFCLEHLNFGKPGTDLRPQVTELLLQAQEQGIVTTSGEDDLNSNSDFSFHHYLIYQGIYESILQSKKEEIHSLYSEFYEQTYEKTVNSVHLPQLLHHLLKLQGEEVKKIKYVRLAFRAFADWNRPIEGRSYYDLLKDLELNQEQEEEKLPIQIAQEERLLGLMQSDLQNYKDAIGFYTEAFSILGCDVSQESPHPLKMAWNIFMCASQIHKLLKTANDQRFIIAIKALSSLLRNTFPKSDIQSLISHVKKRKVVPTFRETTGATRQILESVVEVRALTLVYLHVVLNYVKPGIEVGLLISIYYIAQTVLSLAEGSLQNSLASPSVGVGILLITLGRCSDASQIFSEAMGIYGRVLQVEMSRQGIANYWGWGILFFCRGQYETSIKTFQVYIKLNEKVFGAGPEVTQYAHLHCIVANTLLGNIPELVEEIEIRLNGSHASLVNQMEGAEMKMWLAYQFHSLGKVTEAHELYDKHGDALETIMMKQNPPEWRIISFGVLRCHLEVSKLSTNVISGEELIHNLCRTIEIVCGALKMQKTQQALN